jgi:hypothetical protein
VRQRHIATLGAIQRPTIGARLAFWRELHQRLARLGNRIAADDSAAILGAVQARVPVATVDEQAVERKARLERDLRWWRGHLEASEEFVEAHKGFKTAAEKQIETWSNEVDRARAGLADVEAALEDPEKPAPPELTHKEAMRIWREAGGTKQDLYRGRKLAELSEEEFEARPKRRFRRRKTG